MSPQEKAKALAQAANRCWNAANINNHTRKHGPTIQETALIEQVIMDYADKMVFESRSPSDQSHGW